MSHHTPGPWRHIGIAGGWDGVAPVSGGVEICRLMENNPANCDLIAAAPDLLSDAEAILDIVTLLGEGNAIVLGKRIIDRLRADVAKARGEVVNG